MKHSKKSNVRLVWDNKSKRDLIPFDYFRENRWKSISTNSVHLVEDNFYFLSFLMHLNIKVNLIYIDPPFFTGQNFSTKSGELVYTDKWNSKDAYVQFMYDRLILMRDLLADDGSIYVHCDWRTSGTLKMILDEVFGEENFQNEIIWASGTGNSSNKNKKFIKSHETILYYVKEFNYNWNDVFVELKEKSLYQYKYKDEKGIYRLIPVDQPGKNPYWYDLGMGEKQPSRGYRMPYETAKKWLKEGILVVEAGKVPAKKHYLNEAGVRCKDVWADISGSFRKEFPTQKPEALLERIIRASSNPGDIVADFFMGSGTTCAVAKKLGRHYIGCDSSKLAYETTFKRLQSI